MDIPTHLETEVIEENILTIIKETILIKEGDIFKEIDMQEVMEIIDLILTSTPHNTDI